MAASRYDLRRAQSDAELHLFSTWLHGELSRYPWQLDQIGQLHLDLADRYILFLWLLLPPRSLWSHFYKEKELKRQNREKYY